MPRGKRTIVVAESERDRSKWKKSRKSIAKSVLDNNKKLKRAQLDTWSAIDEWGFTPEEFRLLYCIARHENWKGQRGGRKKRINGCYASADRMNQLTGISRNKIFEILKLFQEANILKRLKARGRTPEKRGQKSGPTFAGWTYEYVINPVTKWLTPWDLAELREELKQEKTQNKDKKT